MRRIKQIFIFLLLIFVFPALASAAWWQFQDRPRSWRTADWSASGVLSEERRRKEAAVFVMAARTGGLKGAFSVHSWLVIKKRGTGSFDRYDKVGWGPPVRKNAYPADGRWYSNIPQIIHAVRGDAAEKLIPHIESAIRAYPHSANGDYRIWPGPNSNSFIAFVLRSVPELGASLPPNAVGRDFVPGFASLEWSPERRDLHASLGGLVGFAAGASSGFELHFLGLVAGLDILKPAVKIPGFGRVDLFQRAVAGPAERQND